MPREANQKSKLLYLMRILLERTDENNTLNASELVSALAAYDIQATRKTVYNDIETLRQFDIDIELQRGKDGGYYAASRDFELAELKLLVDAVQSSRLITDKKCGELIGKLSKLASVTQARQLKRQVYVDGRAKGFNEAVYYNIDAIHDAINQCRKISFRYFDYNTKKKRVYRRDGERYIRTPLDLCWHDDKYYLVTYSAKHGDPFASYRVDRMSDVQMLDDPADIFDRKGFSITEYAKSMFGMYSDETVRARLAFDDGLVSVVLDYFGGNTSMTPFGEGRFLIDANVSQSPVFLSWMFGFGKRAEILAPDSLREAMRELLAINRQIYED